MGRQRRVGTEELTPGFHAYDKWLRYQTYDVTDLIRSGENALGAMLGDGWYKGRFGFDQSEEPQYGAEYGLLCELRIRMADGTERVVCSDTSWRTAPGPVVFSNIYDGETYHSRKEIAGWSQQGLSEDGWGPVRRIDLGYEKLEERRSLPVTIKETFTPADVLTTPAGETVLDLGQNMVGWLRLRVNARAGHEVLLQWGETLHEGNLRRPIRQAHGLARHAEHG